MPKAESSVEITTNSRGDAQLTVKCYAEDVKVALSTCLAMYEEGLVEIERLKVRVNAVTGQLQAEMTNESSRTPIQQRKQHA